jgi:hypothetical protein
MLAPMTKLEILDKLVSFPTVSRDSNRDLESFLSKVCRSLTPLGGDGGSQTPVLENLDDGKHHDHDHEDDD